MRGKVSRGIVSVRASDKVSRQLNLAYLEVAASIEELVALAIETVTAAASPLTPDAIKGHGRCRLDTVSAAFKAVAGWVGKVAESG